MPEGQKGCGGGQIQPEIQGFESPVSGSEAMIEGRVIVESHLYGTLSGGIIWLLERSRSYLTKHEATE